MPGLRIVPGNDTYIPEWVKILTNASLIPLEEPMLTLANFTGAPPGGISFGSFGTIMAVIVVGLLLCIVGVLLAVCFFRRRT